MPIDKTLLSGSTSLLLLKLISEKDMYGYEMIETLRERSENIFELKAGTLYPLLHSLVSQGCLTFYEDDSEGKVRKYYHITKEGKKVLSQREKEWREYEKAMVHVLGGAVYSSV